MVLDAQGPGWSPTSGSRFSDRSRKRWAPDGSANHQEMLLRIYYDGHPRPGVEVPLGDFFANSFGKRTEVISVPVVVEDADSYNCFWHMPFRKSIRIEVENQSEQASQPAVLQHRLDQVDSLPDDTPYFYAQYRQAYPVQSGEGLRGAGDGRQRTLRRHRAGRADSQPLLVRRGRREDLHRRRRRSRRSGARAPKTISCQPGA